MGKHALLAASASERWIRCPPSARLTAEMEDTPSPFAQQGTDAHALCEYLVRVALGQKARDPTEDLEWYDQEMQEAAEGYAAFVLTAFEKARAHCHDPTILLEQRVDFSRWVPEGFGTADCLIIANGTLEIIDFKYGLGVLVSAEGSDGRGNSQLKCYALGALDTFGDLYEIRKVRLSIYQPRRENISEFEMTIADLLQWAEDTLRPRAQLAWEGKGEFEAGDHCVFCKMKATCQKRAEMAMELAKYEFADPPTLSDGEIARILEEIDPLVHWAEDIRAYALKQALSGTSYPGWKIVEGKSNRRITDEARAAKLIQDAGFDPYEKKLLGMTALTKLLGKKRFEELLSALIEKPQGKPTLEPESDKRPAMNNPKNDFD